MKNLQKRINWNGKCRQQNLLKLITNEKQRIDCTKNKCAIKFKNKQNYIQSSSSIQKSKILVYNSQQNSKYFFIMLQLICFIFIVATVIPITNCQDLPNKLNISNPSINLSQINKTLSLSIQLQQNKSQPKPPTPSSPPSLPPLLTRTPTPPLSLNSTTTIPSKTAANTSKITLPAQKIPIIILSLNNTTVYTNIDIIKFVNTQIFKSIQIFMNKFYIEIIGVNSNIQKVCTLKINNTYQIYRIHYGLINNQWDVLDFGFGYDMEKMRIDLVYVRQSVKKYRIGLQFNDSNFDSKRNKFTSDVQKAYALVTKEPLYNSNLTLLSVTITESGISTKQLSVRCYCFKLFDKSFQSHSYSSSVRNITPTAKFQQIQFIYQSPISSSALTSPTSPTPTAIMQMVTLPTAYKPIPIPVSIAVPVPQSSSSSPSSLTPLPSFAQSSPQILTNLQFYFTLTLQDNYNITNFTIKYVQVNTNDQYVYRIQVQIMGQKVVYCQVDTNGVQDPVVIDIWGINDKKNISDNLTIIKDIKQEGTILSSKIPYYQHKFQPISKNTSSATTTTAPNTTATTDQNELTVKQIIQIISNNLKISLENIINTSIAERKTLDNLIDCYSVDFVDGSTKQKKRFVFDIARKRSKSAPTLPVLSNRKQTNSQNIRKSSLLASNSVYMPSISVISSSSSTQSPINTIQIQPVTYFITSLLINYTLDYSNKILSDKIQKIPVGFQDKLKNMISMSQDNVNLGANFIVKAIRNTTKNSKNYNNISVVFCEVTTEDDRICSIAIWLDINNSKIYAIDYLQRGFITAKTSKTSVQLVSIPYIQKIQNTTYNMLYQYLLKNNQFLSNLTVKNMTSSFFKLNFVFMKHRALSIFTSQLQLYYETQLFDKDSNKQQGILVKMSIIYVYNYNFYKNTTNTVNNIMLNIIGQAGLNNQLVQLQQKYKNNTNNCKTKQNPTLVVNTVSIATTRPITSNNNSSTKSTNNNNNNNITLISSCKQCYHNFYLTKQNICVPVVNNCIVQSGNLCLYCLNGYVRNQLYQCQ